MYLVKDYTLVCIHCNEHACTNSYFFILYTKTFVHHAVQYIELIIRCTLISEYGCICWLQNLWSLEVLAKDQDTQSPNDLIDVIFAWGQSEIGQSKFSQPQMFTGALRVASIILSVRVHCDENYGNCSNATVPPPSLTDPSGKQSFVVIVLLISSKYPV